MNLPEDDISPGKKLCMLARIILIGPESRCASDSHLHHEIGMIRQHPVTHRHTEGGHRGNIKRGGRVTSPDYECAQNCSLMVTDRVANIRHWDDICYLYLCYRVNTDLTICSQLGLV